MPLLKAHSEHGHRNHNDTLPIRRHDRSGGGLLPPSRPTIDPQHILFRRLLPHLDAQPSLLRILVMQRFRHGDGLCSAR